MSIYCFLILSSCLLPTTAYTQTSDSEGISVAIEYRSDYVFVRDGLYGVLDIDGHILIPPTYDYIEPWPDFDEHSAMVCKEGEWGVLGANGEELIPFEYDWINYRYPFVMVGKDDKFGFYDQTWKEIVRPTKYDLISPFKADRAIVLVGDKYGLIDGSGREITAIKYDNIIRYKGKVFLGVLNDVAYVISPEGRELKLKSTAAIACQDGAYLYENNDVWGLVDKTGHEVISPYYDYVNPYGSVVVVNKAGKWGAIDVSGKIIIPVVYDSIAYNDARNTGASDSFNTRLNDYHQARQISEKTNWFVCKKNGQKEYFDIHGRNIGESGTTIIKKEYEDGLKRKKYQSDGYLIDRESTLYEGWSVESYYLTDANLHPIMKEGYTEIRPATFASKDDLVFVAKMDSTGDSSSNIFLLGGAGERLSGPYESVTDLYSGMFIVKKNGMYEIVDRYGKRSSPVRGNNVYKSGRSYDIVEVENESGEYVMMNLAGEEISDPGFLRCEFNGGDRAWVRKGGKYGSVDRHGTFVIPPQYAYAEAFNSGLALVRESTSPSAPNYKLVRRDGSVVFRVPNGWRPIDIMFHAGMFRFRNSADKICFVDQLGETAITVDPIQYTDSLITFSPIGLLPVQSAETGLWGYMAKSGQLVFECRYSVATPFEWDPLFGVYYAQVQVDGDESYSYIDSDGYEIDDFLPSSSVLYEVYNNSLINEYLNPFSFKIDDRKMLEDYYSSDYDMTRAK